ncbi:pentapeptide repeat-containing protein [Bacteroides sp.]|uniref:pentapeptide repeat-containing protein n=1 Tax=Bacteroides sp. TaxID=29523 RepID=UPI00261D7502|nr:pentapeptide repeat-containing protein [Bacteroides sp.]MDD3039083.1 pentapeptide repeat-containing protein [Bacteroides sp.]
MCDKPVDAFIHNNLLVEIHNDDVCPTNPVKEYDLVGTMITTHRKYALGHIQKQNPADILEHMFTAVIDTADDETQNKILNDLADAIPAIDIYFDEYGDEEYDLSDVLTHCAEELYYTNPETILSIIDEYCIILPLYLFDHSGVAISTHNFNDPWDSGQIGYIYAKKESEGHSDEELRKILNDEIELYDSYLRGECYGFEIYDPHNKNEPIDSCWGYIGDIKHCINDAKSTAETLNNTSPTLPTYKDLSRIQFLDLIEAYDSYIQDANENDRYDSGWRPVCISEFYDNEYLGEQKMKTLTQNELDKILKNHEIWLNDPNNGRCANLSNTNLSEANLFKTDLSYADLSGADITEADLSKTNLSNTDLSYANLFGADLSYANLFGANLFRANLFGANLSHVNISKTYLSEANLSKTNLSEANLSRTNLSEANLSETNLTGTNFFGANLTGTNLIGANLTGANLDLSCLPLHCGSLDMLVDRRIAIQILYHFCALKCDDPEITEIQNSLIPLANQFHRTDVKKLKGN